MPAAVLTRAGRVLSTNALFDGLTNLFMPVAFDRLAIANVGANRLFQQAVEATGGTKPPFRSIRLPKLRNAAPASFTSCRCAAAPTTSFQAATWLWRSAR